VASPLDDIERAVGTLARERRAAPFLEAGEGAAVAGPLRAAATTRGGELYDDGCNVDGFVLAPAGPSRMIVGVTQANEKGTVTAYAGAVVLLELDRAAREGTSAEAALEAARARVERLDRAAYPVANDRFYSAGSGASRKATGLGAGVLALDVDGSRATVCHAGECTAYRVRDGAAARIAMPHTLGEIAKRNGDAELLARIVDEPWTAEIVMNILGRQVQVETSSVDVQPGDVLVACTARVGHLALDVIARATGSGDVADVARALAGAVPPGDRESYGVTLVAIGVA
jgi:hypothetical protein